MRLHDQIMHIRADRTHRHYLHGVRNYGFFL